MSNLDPTRELRNTKFLPGSSGIWVSYQEFLAGISGIRDSWQEIHDFPGRQMLGVPSQCVAKFRFASVSFASALNGQTFWKLLDLSSSYRKAFILCKIWVEFVSSFVFFTFLFELNIDLGDIDTSRVHH